MARTRDHGATLKALVDDGGAVRLPKKKQLALPHIVEEFLSLSIARPDSYPAMSSQKQAEIDRELVGFAKAQEKLREFIALCGVEAIADLADVRDDSQPQSELVGGRRVWMP